MEFREFLLSIGLLPLDIEPGKWLRCHTTLHPRKRNGSFKLALDGEVGWGQDYAQHSEPVFWRRGGDSAAAQRIDPAEIARRRAEERAAARAATAAAQAHYAAARPLAGSHPYLEKKCLPVAGCGGLRVDGEGWLLVPMRVGAEMVSVQRISPAGDKRFWPGAPTSGSVYWIGPRAAPFVVVCEGFATGLSIHQAMPDARVLVAFNAGNLAQAVLNVPAHGLAVMAADNDHQTALRVGFNPGIEKATEAGLARGIGIAYPTCSGSDWDDYRQERIAELTGIEALKRRPRPAHQILAAVNAEIAIALRRAARRPD